MGFVGEETPVTMQKSVASRGNIGKASSNGEFSFKIKSDQVMNSSNWTRPQTGHNTGCHNPNRDSMVLEVPMSSNFKF